MSNKTQVRADQVISTAKGWTKWTKDDGKVVSTRTKQIEVVTEGAATQPKASDGLRRIGDKSHRVSVRHYLKTVANSGHGSLDCGDGMAARLRGMALEDVYAEAARVLAEDEKALKARYAHLNPGMQRMNLGNRMRAA